MTVQVEIMSIVFFFSVHIVREMYLSFYDLSDEGRDVTNFTCQGIGKYIDWYFNGVLIDVSDTSKYRIESTSINTTTESTITVYNITSSDSGVFTCKNH